MPKKKHKTRSKSAARSSPSTIGRQAGSTAESRLLWQFATWYDTHLDDIEEHDAHAAAADIRSLLSLLFEMTQALGHRHTLAAPTATTLTALLNAVEADEELADALPAVTDTLMHYLEFLAETNAWKASEADYDASFDVLEEVVDAQPGIMQLLLAALAEVPDVHLDEQLAGLETLKPVAAVDGLLDWIGRSHVVTSTGAPRLGDIEAVAALIGINAVGRKMAKREPASLVLIEPLVEPELVDAGLVDAGPIDADARLVVGSMWDVAGLAVWWQILLGLGVIETTSTTVRPGPAIGDWQSEDASQRFALRAEFARLYVSFWFQREAAEAGIFAPFVFMHLLARFASAVNPGALPQSGGKTIIEVLETSVEEAGLDLGRIAGYRTEVIMREVEAAGLIASSPVPDGTVRKVVPMALRPIVAAALRETGAELMQPAEAAPPNEHPNGTALQLKIAIANTHPPVWRRVMVDANATLGDLHDVIQKSFRWQYTHMHRFELAGWYSGAPAFGPLDGFSDEPDDVIDEDTVSVGLVLVDPGDKLYYLYDFGDDWKHLIQLEKISPVGTETTPHCVGGRGLAPDEDSGGPWRWSDLVHIAEDPDHPDWEDVRDELGLEPGEHIDPGHFDVDEVNERLAMMRH